MNVCGVSVRCGVVWARVIPVRRAATDCLSAEGRHTLAQLIIIFWRIALFDATQRLCVIIIIEEICVIISAERYVMKLFTILPLWTLIIASGLWPVVTRASIWQRDLKILIKQLLEKY